MTDRERIEAFIQTLMILKNCMSILKKDYDGEDLHRDLDKVSGIIERVIQKNADYIKLDL